MSDKLMYIPNNDTQIFPSVDQNYCLKRLKTQQNNQQIKVPKDIKPTKKKALL